MIDAAPERPANGGLYTIGDKETDRCTDGSHRDFAMPTQNHPPDVR